MSRLVGLALAILALSGLFSAPARAARLPLVISATVDYTHDTLTISGQNFGSFPAVTLDSSFSGSPCIDSAFGPTQADFYRPLTTVAANWNATFGVSFFDGHIAQLLKSGSTYARAVRSGR